MFTPYKSAFEIAAQQGNLSVIGDADAGAAGIPAAIAVAAGKVASVNMTDGVITATGTAEVGGYTITYTPNGIVAPIQWTKGGTCVAAGIC